MPTIYLKHPRHGTKVATMEIEAVADEKNGWVRYTHATPPVSDDAVPVNQLGIKRKYTRRVVADEVTEGV
mgnify:CR=1 FL=1